MIKVYCKDCKWFLKIKVKNKSIPPSSFCNQYCIERPDQRLNTKGKCPYYQRKWWKFWLTRKD